MASTSPDGEEENPEVILANYKSMLSECQKLNAKITELSLEKDEHRLVIETLSKLEGTRKAFKLIGGVLVELTVADVLPSVSQNFEGVRIRSRISFKYFYQLNSFNLIPCSWID